MTAKSTRAAATATVILTSVAIVIGYSHGAVDALDGCALAATALWAGAGWCAWWTARKPLVAVGSLATAAALAADRFHPGGRIPATVAGATAVVIGLWWLARTAARGFRGGRAAEREALRWLAAGVTAAGSVTVVVLTLHLLVGWPHDLRPPTVMASAIAALAVGASSSGRLAGLAGRALADSFVAAGFVLVLAAVYLVIVKGLGNPPTENGDRETLGLSVVVATLAAVSFGPARSRMVVTANRLVFGSRRTPDDLIRAFSARLTRSTPMEELLLQLAESLVRTMGLTSAHIYTGGGDVLERVAAVPDGAGAPSLVVTSRERPAVVRAAVSGNAWIEVWLPAVSAAAGPEAQLRAAPIRNAGELLGLLVVDRAPSAEPFSEDDDRILGDLAREVGLALHNVRLDAALQDTLAELRVQAAELRESRARIVATADAERRRVERNLHDGAQQSLVALAIGLRLARDLLDRDPSEAARVLDDMKGEVQNTIDEVRELAHGIYPPLLASGGLRAALEGAVSRSPLAVELDVRTEARFDQHTEAAVYFCCLEALQNTAKHAPDANVRIRIWCETGILHFQVLDDGPGFDPSTKRGGHGLTNMTDRLGAIGGSVRWQSSPGAGVDVSGSVPVPTSTAPP